MLALRSRMNPSPPSSLLEIAHGRRGHFCMESGYHSEWWFALDRLFDAPARLQPYVQALAARIKPHGIDAVCGPQTGGAMLAAMLATELGVACFTTERIQPPDDTSRGLFPVRYVVPAAQRAGLRGRVVAVVDDAISAGSAVRGTLADLAECGAQPRVIGALLVFGDAAARFAADRGLALEKIQHVPFGMWPPAACPLCAAGAPLERVSDAI